MRPPKSHVGLWLCVVASLCSVPSLFGQNAPKPAQIGTPSTAAVFNAPTETKKWTGDLDEMLKRRVIRVGVPYSKTLYYTVKGVQWGVAYEGGKEFEKYLNAKYPQRNKNLKIIVMFFVTPREEAVERLNQGTLDLLIAGLTITPERQKVVDFSNATVSGVKEVVVTGPGGPGLKTIDDLSGKEVFARKTSSYWEHLEGLNEQFKKEGKAQVKLTAVPEDLGDEDLLEMVNEDLAVATGESLGWAMRKNSPKLLETVNAFLKVKGPGTKFGNELLTRYTGSTYMLKQATSEASMKRFEETADIFKKYGRLQDRLPAD